MKYIWKYIYAYLLLLGVVVSVFKQIFPKTQPYSDDQTDNLINETDDLEINYAEDNLIKKCVYIYMIHYQKTILSYILNIQHM